MPYGSAEVVQGYEEEIKLLKATVRALKKILKLAGDPIKLTMAKSKKDEVAAIIKLLNKMTLRQVVLSRHFIRGLTKGAAVGGR
jgi:histidyl-tRNA synthetase